MAGVPVAGRVEVTAGEGVMTKKVGVLAAGLGLPRTGIVAVCEAGAVVVKLAVAVKAGTDRAGTGRFITNKTVATATDNSPPINDQRARTTYLCLIR